MKALTKIFIAAIAAASMTACNNELSEQTSQNGGNVNFTMGIGSTPSSRVSMPESSYTASFTGDDEVGVFVSEVSSYSNIKYSTTDGTTWTGGPIEVPTDAEYTYYAYYPYKESMTASNIPVVVATNQDTDGYIKNDYLYSKLVATSGQTDVNLTFNHALSLVEVTLAGSGAAEGATVNLFNVATDATMDIVAGNVTTGSVTADVTMDALSNLKYRAIIPAQTIAASTPAFKIAVNGRTYQAKYSGDINFEQGKYLAMTITLGEQGGDDAQIEITTTADIADWGEGTSNGGQAEIEEVPLISKFEETDFVSANSSTLAPLGSNSTWFYILGTSAGSESKCEITDSETTAGDITPVWQKQANVTFVSTYESEKSSANNWYTAALGYFCKGFTKETSMYKLSFKAKAKVKVGSDDSSSSESIQLYVICRTSKNDACFAIRNNTDAPTATNSTKNLTANWDEYSFYIHFDKKLDGNPRSLSKDSSSGSYTEEFTATEPEDYQNIQIRLCTTGGAASADATPKATTLSVTDVKLEPYVNN